MHKLYCEENKLSYGQKYLLDICDQRKITYFAVKELNNEFSVGHLMKVATGATVIPSFKFIYMCKHLVNPLDWFYTLEEPRPEVIPPEEVVLISESKNFHYLKNLYEQKKLTSWCKENDINYMSISHIVITERNSPSPTRCKELSKILPIKDWFIK